MSRLLLLGKRLREERSAERSKLLTLRTMNGNGKRQAALTLTELLCVIAIILILASLYLPTIARAYRSICTFLEEM